MNGFKASGRNLLIAIVSVFLIALQFAAPAAALSVGELSFQQALPEAGGQAISNIIVNPTRAYVAIITSSGLTGSNSRSSLSIYSAPVSSGQIGAFELDQKLANANWQEVRLAVTSTNIYVASLESFYSEESRTACGRTDNYAQFTYKIYLSSFPIGLNGKVGVVSSSNIYYPLVSRHYSCGGCDHAYCVVTEEQSILDIDVAATSNHAYFSYGYITHDDGSTPQGTVYSNMMWSCGLSLYSVPIQPDGKLSTTTDSSVSKSSYSSYPTAHDVSWLYSNIAITPSKVYLGGYLVGDSTSPAESAGYKIYSVTLDATGKATALVQDANFNFYSGSEDYPNYFTVDPSAIQAYFTTYSHKLYSAPISAGAVGTPAVEKKLASTWLDYKATANSNKLYFTSIDAVFGTANIYAAPVSNAAIVTPTPNSGSASAVRLTYSSPYSNPVIYAGLGSGKVYAGTSGAWTIHSTIPSIPTGSLLTAMYSPSNSQVYSGLSGGKVYAKSGSTWLYQDTTGISLSSGAYLTGLTWSNYYIYAVSSDGKVYRRIDSGTSWSQAGSIIISSGAAITGIEPLSNALYAVSSDGKVYVSSNGGSTWILHSTITLPDGAYLAGTYASSTALFTFASNGVIYLLSDTGTTWTSPTYYPQVPVPAGQVMTSLAYDYTTGNRVRFYAGLSDGQVYGLASYSYANLWVKVGDTLAS